MDKVKAVINGDRIECGKCGALICVLKTLNTGHQRSLIEYKCKHKDKGSTCNTINEILL